MGTTDRCDEIVRLIDRALADCASSTPSRRVASRRRCTATAQAADSAAEQRGKLLAAVDDFLADTLIGA
jgi:hypothetical protein